jgi:uncharacterized protein YcgI (DUF1989 family)
MEIDVIDNSQLILVPARRGLAIRAAAGALVKVFNTHGKQVVDTWALNAADLNERMSMEHTRAFLKKLNPNRGDALVTNHRRPILSIEEDTTPGVHDTLIAACDRYRYQQLGVSGYHDNCADNFAAALRELKLQPVAIPSPLNLFMNIPVGADGRVEFRAPLSEPGQYVSLRVHMDAVLVFSACPQDLLPVNGERMTPTEVHLGIA